MKDLEARAFDWHRRTLLAETPECEHLMAYNHFVDAAIARIIGCCTGVELRKQLAAFVKEVAA